MTTPSWVAHLPADVEPESVDLLAEGSLPAAWARRWKAAPEAETIFCEQPDREGRVGWVSGGELEWVTRSVARRFARSGLRRGDRVVVSAGPSHELVIAHVAALRLGLVVVPANTAYLEPEIAHIVSDASPSAAIVDDPERGDWVRCASGGRAIVVSPAIELEDAPASSLNGLALDDVGPSDPALICYTSGTTGAPKGAVLSHGNLLAGSEALRLAWRWTQRDRLVLALPLFHVHGLAVGLHGTLLAGASAVLLPRFEPDLVFDAISQHHATLFFGVPTMYHRLAASPRVGELRSLRLCVSGSAPLPAALYEQLAAGSDQRVLERYGMTETMMNVSNPYEGERRPGSVGLPLPGVELSLSEGDHGEILLKGPNVFAGYWRNPAATAGSFDAEGRFRTGDIGRLDSDGYLRIEGRAKELIITGGFNVYPREVEEVLRAHPKVADVAVAGTPSAVWGEVVTAYLVPRAPDNSVDVDDLLAFASERLAPYKRPRLVHQVDAIPRNAMGKILRHQLAPE